MVLQNSLMLARRCHFLPRRLQFFISNRKCGTDNTTPVKLSYISYESVPNSSTPQPLLPPILIMHGLFGSKNNWNSLAKAIHQNTKRKVIAIDARNHGDSPHSPHMSYQHMSADIAYLLKDQGIDKIVLVGHSMGGGTVMYTALNYPDLVDKLVVVDFSPIRASDSLLSMRKLFQAMQAVKLQGATTLSKARKVANDQMLKAIPSDSIRQFLLMNLVEAETGNFKWRINLPVLEEAFASRIAIFPNVGNKTYTGPTFFIGGADSDYIKESDHDRIKKLFPTANFHYITGAGHWVHADKSTEFLESLNRFINEKSNR